jgi:hypothetical protein
MTTRVRQYYSGKGDTWDSWRMANMMSCQNKFYLYFIFHILKLSLECENTPTSLIRYTVSNDKLTEFEIEGNIVVTTSESLLVQVDLLNNTKLCNKMLSISYSVRSLWFSAGNIREIESELLKNQKVSDNLHITDGKIQTIKKHTFKDLEVSVLGLYSNEIVTIEEEAFVGLPFVSLINLSYNKIEWIHLRSFVDVPELISLDLSHNNISRIEKHFFHFCQQNSLSIKLSYNRIESVDDEAFAGSTLTTVELDLNWNHIEFLSFGIFQGRHFDTINLLGNNISKISTKFFDQHYDIDTLDVNLNHMDEENLEVLRNWAQKNNVSLHSLGNSRGVKIEIRVLSMFITLLVGKLV